MTTLDSRPILAGTNLTDRRLARGWHFALVVLMVAAPILSQPSRAAAETAEFFVSTSGRNTNPGTLERPWRTLQRAANAAPAGSTIRVRGGTYAGFVMTRSGRPGAPIKFMPYGNESVVLAGNQSTTNVVRISGAHHVVIRGFVVRNARASQSGSGILVDRQSYRITVTNNIVTDNRSFGVSIIDSTYVLVNQNEIKRNAEGVYIRGQSTGIRVVDNHIHHQDRMVVATVGGTDDHGGVGVSLVRTVGSVVVTRNQIHGNRAVSPDWGYDGAGIEIYGGDGAKIRQNRIWDNRVVMETGSGGDACRDNVFVRNVIWGATTRDVSKGMLLRCAEGMLIANNTFYRLDEWVFDLKEGGSGHATSIRGLRILNNISVMSNGKIYGVESAIPGSVVVDYNLIWHTERGTLATVVGFGRTSRMSTLTAWTGFNAHGVNKAPLFIAAGGHDFHLRSASPAIDAGRMVGHVTEGYRGSAPDLGRFEAR